MQPAQIHKDGLQQYVFFPLEKKPKEGYVNQLFQYHKIPGFLNYEIRNMNEQYYIYYRLKHKSSIGFLKEHLSFHERMMDGMVHSVLEIMKTCKDYLLSCQNIIWSTEYIFIDMETGKLEFCYCPIELEDNNVCVFLSELMQIIGKKNEAAMLTLMQLYDYVTEPESWDKENLLMPQRRSADVFQVEEDVEADCKNTGDKDENSEEKEEHKEKNKKEGCHRKKLIFWCILSVSAVLFILFAAGICFGILDSKYTSIIIILFVLIMGFLIMGIPEQKKEKDRGTPTLQDYFADSKEDAEAVQEEEEKRNRRPLFQPDEALYGETTILQEEPPENSRIFIEDYPRELMLYPKTEHQYPDMEIHSHSIIVGCMKENCDYVLSKRGISRIHAKLIKVENMLYILDLNSTNGTYLNGERLEGGKDYLLKKGDLVAFSHVEFLVDEKTEKKEMY